MSKRPKDLDGIKSLQGLQTPNERRELKAQCQSVEKWEDPKSNYYVPNENIFQAPTNFGYRK